MIPSLAGALIPAYRPYFSIIADKVNLLLPATIDGPNVPAGSYGISTPATTSGDFVSDWVTSEVTVGASATAPDRTSTADKIVESVNNSEHFLSAGFIYDGLTIEIKADMTATRFRYSVFAKAGERTRVVISLVDSVYNSYPSVGGPGRGGCKAVFDLAGGQVAVAATAFGHGFTAESESIESYGNGWYRCTIVVTVGALYLAIPFIINAKVGIDAGSGVAPENSTYAGNGTSGLYVWRANCLPDGAFDVNTRLFYDSFDNSTNLIDVADTRQPGYNWYVRSAWPGFQYYSGSSDPSDYTISGSVLTLNRSETPPPNTVLSTAVWTDSENPPPTPGVAGNWTGNAWQPPFLFECSASWPNVPVGTTAWPAWWSAAIEAMTVAGPTGEFPSSVHYLEIDMFEVATLAAPPISGAGTPALALWDNGTTRITNGAMGGCGLPFSEVLTYQSGFHRHSRLMLPQQSSSAFTFLPGQHNILLNTDFSGATPGTPGVPPTGMDITVTGDPLTTEIVSVIGGRIQIRVTGTSVAGSTLNMFFVLPTDPNTADNSIAQNQIWTGSVVFKWVANTSVPLIIGTTLSLVEMYFFGGWNFTDNGTSTVIYQIENGIPVLDDPVRLQCTRRIQNSATDGLYFRWSMGLFPGDYDFTIEFYQPQLERGMVPSPFQATAGAVEGVDGISESEAADHYGSYHAFWDGIYCASGIISSQLWATPQVPVGSYAVGLTQHFPMLLATAAITGTPWPVDFDYVSVYGRR